MVCLFGLFVWNFWQVSPPVCGVHQSDPPAGAARAEPLQPLRCARGPARSLAPLVPAHFWLSARPHGPLPHRPAAGRAWRKPWATAKWARSLLPTMPQSSSSPQVLLTFGGVIFCVIDFCLTNQVLATGAPHMLSGCSRFQAFGPALLPPPTAPCPSHHAPPPPLCVPQPSCGGGPRRAASRCGRRPTWTRGSSRCSA